jgi:hypothetical protein
MKLAAIALIATAASSMAESASSIPLRPEAGSMQAQYYYYDSYYAPYYYGYPRYYRYRCLEDLGYGRRGTWGCG